MAVSDAGARGEKVESVTAGGKMQQQTTNAAALPEKMQR